MRPWHFTMYGLLVALTVGIVLSELDVWLNRPEPGTNLPRGVGTFVSYNLFLVSTLAVEEATGELPGATKTVRLVRGLLFGVLLATMAWCVDLVFRRFGGFQLRAVVFATVLVSFAIASIILFPITGFSGPSTGRDFHARWLIFAEWRFQALSSLGRQTPVMVSYTYRRTAREFLAWEEEYRSTDVILLHAGFERAFSPTLGALPLNIPSLDRNPLVLTTADPQLAAGLQADPSLRGLAGRARRGDITILILDPASDPAGMAALLLLRTLQADSDDGDRLLRNVEIVPGERQLWDTREVVSGVRLATITRPAVVFLIDNFRCAELQERVEELRAVHPAEGSVVLDYPVVLTPWSKGEYRELAERYVEFLASPQAQKFKERYPTPVCLADEPPRVIDPALDDVRAWMQAWDAHAATAKSPE